MAETAKSLAAKKAKEEKTDRGYAPDDIPDDIVEGHTEGASSWWSDPDATAVDQGGK